MDDLWPRDGVNLRIDEPCGRACILLVDSIVPLERPTAIFSHNPLNWARLDQESIRLLVFGLTMDSWDSRLVKSTLMAPGG